MDDLFILLLYLAGFLAAFTIGGALADLYVYLRRRPWKR